MEREAERNRVIKNGHFVKLPVINKCKENIVILFRSVVDLALSDALGGKEIYENNFLRRKENTVLLDTGTFITYVYDDLYSWNTLTNWFDINDPDFITICGFAELDPLETLEEIERILIITGAINEFPERQLRKQTRSRAPLSKNKQLLEEEGKTRIQSICLE